MGRVSNMRPQSHVKRRSEENSGELQQGLQGDRARRGASKLCSYILSGSDCRYQDPVYFNNRVYVQVFSNSIASRGAGLPIQSSAELFDLRRCHGWSVLPNHLSKVLRQRIDLLLEKEKGGSKGTQLPLINNKGEFIHLIKRASKDKLQRH